MEESKKTEHIKGTQSIVLDFSEQKVSKIAFARTKEEAERIERQLGMTVYFPSEIANFDENEIPMYVLIGQENVPAGILFVTYEKDGNKYLTLIKNDGEKKLWERNFLVEHLVDENLKITNQTLEQEKRMFIKSSSTK